ncbi:MAG TPA: tetratricopeptide repeat protein [Pyrinomonadaceae bacterium]|nr:tetratricopeptide repeat protein [Pyrinomonadaceae bacterium]
MKHSLNRFSILLAACALACAQASAQDSKPTPKKRAAASKTAKSDTSARPAKEKTTAAGETTTQEKTAKKPPKPSSKTARAKPKVVLSEEELKARLDSALKLTPSESVKELEELVAAHTQSALRPRAQELLTAARAALGDETLKAGDATRGIELFRLAVAEAPSEIPDKLFADVISQLPANLFLRGQSAAAFELARAVEERVKENPKRLLNLAGFYMSVEQPVEAARLAEAAIRLAPDMSVAHYALGTAQRVALKLDEAAAAYRRALELDPQATTARRSLADLERAAGKSEDALALYRELLAADPKDASARTGAVLALLDAGKREDAERELQAALQDEPQNLSLLVGAAWWYVSHGAPERAEELGVQAVRLEPRYTWAQIALARALVAQKRPMEAERSLRFARQYGRFPTLDYELANALAASGLYEEAAEELARAFQIKDGQLVTQLAGRVLARADNFTELLALERRASIFQHAAADTETNARMLKNLLAFHLLMKEAGGSTVFAKDSGATEARAFVSDGDTEMRAFRRIYAASRLLKHGAALGEVLKLAEEAASEVDVALNSPSAQTALLADELREVRARALAGGSLPGLPEVPRNVLSNVMRGRIEDLAGWSLFIEGKSADAVVRLKRARSVLPENSLWWRNAMWHLGAALDATGNQKDALDAYLKSYNRQSPDAARRVIIEALYQRVNGTLEGLDEKIGPAPNALTTALTSPAPPPATTEAPKSDAPANADPARANESITTPLKSDETTLPPAAAAATPTPELKSEAPPPTDASRAPETKPETSPETKPVEASPEVKPVEVPTEAKPVETKPEPAPTPTRETTTTQEATPVPSPTPPSPTVVSPTPEPSATPQPSPTPATTAPTAETTPQPSPTPAPQTDAEELKPERGGGDVACALSLSVRNSLTIERGGSATLTVSFAEAGGASRIKAATANWSDIVVLAEPRAAAESSEARFTITSISQKAGDYTVTFKAPCGSKKLTVIVK